MTEHGLLGEWPVVCRPGGEGFYAQGYKKTRIMKGIKFWTEEFIVYSKFEFYSRVRGDVISSVA